MLNPIKKKKKKKKKKNTRACDCKGSKTQRLIHLHKQNRKTPPPEFLPVKSHRRRFAFKKTFLKNCTTLSVSAPAQPPKSSNYFSNAQTQNVEVTSTLLRYHQNVLITPLHRLLHLHSFSSSSIFANHHPF